LGIKKEKKRSKQGTHLFKKRGRTYFPSAGLPGRRKISASPFYSRVFLPN
jgi:hypothetical protein